MNIIHLNNLYDSPLLKCFESFYYDLLRQKERALRVGFLSNMEYASDDASLLLTPTSSKAITIAEEIQFHIKQSIEQQGAFYARKTGGVNLHLFQDVQYCMVALADEVFLNLPFSGAKEWRLSLLESQLFQSQRAGELFFKKIDTLLDSIDTSRYELAQIYLFAINLGFKGQYQGAAASEQLQWYKQQLYQLICHQQPQLFYNDQTVLFEQCTNHTLVGLPSRGLPDLRTWGKYLLWITIIYAICSQFVWYRITKEMKEDIQTIENSTRYTVGEL